MEIVEISNEAQEDFLDVYSELYEKNIDYADHWEREFFKKIELLETFPYMGRIVPEAESLRNFRELLIDNYRILYVVGKTKVVVVGIRLSKKPLNTK